MVGVVTDRRAADWAGNVDGDLPGQPIHSFSDEDRARRVEVLRMAPGGVLEHGEAHRALLEESGGGAAFAKGGEGSDGVVAHDDPRVGQVEHAGGGLEGKDPTEGFTADLVLHVLCIWKGADDDLALLVGPPPDDYPPAMDGGVPGYEHHA